MHLIPQSWSHVHILLGVFPSFGLLFVLGFYIAGITANNAGIKRTCLALFGLLALLSIPTYLSGTGAMAALSGNAKISKDVLNAHYVWSIAALVALVVTGVVAVIELLRSGGAGSRNAHLLVLGLAVVALGLMVVAGGRQMHNPELQ